MYQRNPRLRVMMMATMCACATTAGGSHPKAKSLLMIEREGEGIHGGTKIGQENITSSVSSDSTSSTATVMNAAATTGTTSPQTDPATIAATDAANRGDPLAGTENELRADPPVERAVNADVRDATQGEVHANPSAAAIRDPGSNDIT